MTAQHVIPPLLDESTRFGGSILPYEHSLIVHKSDVHVVELPKTGQHGDRPDIAFILLFTNRLEKIQAIKSFWSISHYREKVLCNTWAKENCLWVISGCPGVFSKEEKPTAQFQTVKSFMNLLGFSGVEREYFQKEFDYLDVSVLYQQGSGLPPTFGGMSGGGLWQIAVWESENGVIQAKDPLLYGLACREIKIEGDVHQIVCHGPHSIYKMLCDLVEKEYSH